MTTDAPGSEIEVVRSFLKALEAMDLDGAMTYLSPDIEYQNMPVPPVRGHAGVHRVLRPFLRVIHEFEARVNHIAADGPFVLTERTDAMIVGPVRIPFPVCGTFEVRDGQIVLWRDTFDWMTIIVNTLLAGPLYLSRRAAMGIALKVAARKG